MREIPPDCSPLITDILKAGLQKEPMRRASPSELRVQATQALQAGEKERSAITPVIDMEKERGQLITSRERDMIGKYLSLMKGYFQSNRGTTMHYNGESQ